MLESQLKLHKVLRMTLFPIKTWLKEFQLAVAAQDQVLKHHPKWPKTYTTWNITHKKKCPKLPNFYFIAIKNTLSIFWLLEQRSGQGWLI